MKITRIAGVYAVSRLSSDAEVPNWAYTGKFCSITRTGNELSIVCDADAVPPGVRSERDWVAFEVEGPIPFETTGVLAGVASAIANAGISLFAIATYDTDYLLVKADKAHAAADALRAAGYQVSGDV